MRDVVVFDLDGTLSDHAHRQHHLRKEPKDWDAYFDECHLDKPIQWIVNFTHFFWHYSGDDVVILTGRSDRVKDKTISWLQKYNVWFDHLIMRPEKDHRHDVELKPELLTLFSDRVKLIIEDRNSMVRKWRELGYNVLQPYEVDY